LNAEGLIMIYDGLFTVGERILVAHLFVAYNGLVVDK